LEQAAQASGGVTIPRGVQNTCRYGTWELGLAGMVVLGWQLDLMILGVFSNPWLYDSMILILLLFTQCCPLAMHPLTAAGACSVVSSLHPVNHYHEHRKDVSGVDCDCAFIWWSHSVPDCYG